jgi:hypothetical protein
MRRIVPLLACTLAAPMAQAAGPSFSDVLVNSGISVAGHVSGSYTMNFNKGQTLSYRAFDAKSDSFDLNQAWLNVGMQPSEGFGGVVTAMAGTDASGVNASYGVGASDFSLVQGFLQYASGPFTIMAGRYVTLAGFEVIDDTANTNISRSLLFQNAEPLVHTGVRTATKLGSMATLYLGAANSAVTGAANDVNKEKTAEVGLMLMPSSAVSIGLYDYYGLEGVPVAAPGGGKVNVKTNFLDFVASVQATSALQLALNADWARSIGAGVTVAGVAGYANVTWSDSFKTSLRVEYLKTTNYIVPADTADNKSNLYDITLTGDYSASKNFDLLAEFRIDGSNHEVFPFDTDAKKQQPDVAIKAIYKFGTPSGS